MCLLSIVLLAVTLDGTIIHKSGLMTGGRSTHNNSKKWDEKDVQGEYTTDVVLYLNGIYDQVMFRAYKASRHAHGESTRTG